MVDGAYKDVKNIQQFYDDTKVMRVSGRSSREIVYDPETMSDAEFDLSIVESTATPVYRQFANDFVLEIWRAGQINLEQMLEFVDFPGSAEMLQSVQAQREQLEAEQQAMLQAQGGMPQAGQEPMMQ